MCRFGKAINRRHCTDAGPCGYQVISIDYIFLSQNSAKTSPRFAAMGGVSKAFGARVAPPMANPISVAQRVVQWINGLGHGKVMFKSDKEPSIIDLQRALKIERQQAIEDMTKHMRAMSGFDDELEDVDVVTENSPVGNPQSNDVVENAVRPLQRESRTLKVALGDLMKHKIDMGPNIWHWMVDYAVRIFIKSTI